MHPKRFIFFAARTGQPPISVLRSQLQQQLYLYSNFICTKRLSVVQFGCLLDVPRPRGAAPDQKRREMDDALNFIIL